MERQHILHMFTPGPQVSPFDVNMAADAGYTEEEAIVAILNVAKYQSYVHGWPPDPKDDPI